MTSKEELTKYIGSRIREYLESGRRNASISTLSRHTGRSWTTIKRIAQNEVSKISADNAYSLLTFLDGKDKSSKLMKGAFPVWYKSYFKNLPSNKISSLSTAAIEWNRYSTWILNMASRQAGVTEETISNKFGEIGIDELNKLIQSGFIDFTQGKFVATSYIKDPNSVSAFARIKSDAENFQHEKIGTNSFYFRKTEEISKNTAFKVNKLLEEFYEKVREEISKDELSSENNNVFLTLNCFSDTVEGGEQ